MKHPRYDPKREVCALKRDKWHLSEILANKFFAGQPRHVTSGSHFRCQKSDPTSTNGDTKQIFWRLVLEWVTLRDNMSRSTLRSELKWTTYEKKTYFGWYSSGWLLPEVISGLKSWIWGQLTKIQKQNFVASARKGNPFRKSFPVSKPRSEIS